MIADYIKYSISTFKHRKVRSGLTIIGIIIGIASIIALIAISQGLQNSIKEQFESFGANRLFIAGQGFSGPGSQSEGLTTDDVETLERITEFSYVSPMLFRTAEVKRRDETKFTFIQALPAEDYEEAFADVGIELETGRPIRKGDKFEVVLGYRAAKDLFKEEIHIRNKILIEGKEFKVVGIYKEVGNRDDDNAISIPLESAREIFDEPEQVDAIIAQAKPGTDLKAIQAKAERNLERDRGDENFQVVTAAQVAEQINSVLGIVQIVLVGIAAISLIVGGIGIMNSMYTSVIERTKQIGVMKAIGARNADILSLFLIESGFLGLVGGFFGTLLGAGVAYMVGFAAKQAGFGILSIHLQPTLLIFGLLFAFVVGMVSGAIPAWQASKLKPVDALRYE